MITTPKVVSYGKLGNTMTLRLSNGQEFSFDAESLARLIQQGADKEGIFVDEGLQEVLDDEARAIERDILDDEGRQEVLDDEAREIEQDIINEEEDANGGYYNKS